mgnify:CR=1 FL=1
MVVVGVVVVVVVVVVVGMTVVVVGMVQFGMSVMVVVGMPMEVQAGMLVVVVHVGAAQSPYGIIPGGKFNRIPNILRKQYVYDTVRKPKISRP